jgi:hypothetical protein
VRPGKNLGLCPKRFPRPVARLLQAANANDVDAFLATFADEGVVW